MTLTDWQLATPFLVSASFYLQRRTDLAGSGQANAQHPTSNEYEKIPNVGGLYRHTISGRYYGAKKIHGKRREVSLRTTDRKIAERRLRDWISPWKIRARSEADQLYVAAARLT